VLKSLAPSNIRAHTKLKPKDVAIAMVLAKSTGIIDVRETTVSVDMKSDRTFAKQKSMKPELVWCCVRNVKREFRA